MTALDCKVVCFCCCCCCLYNYSVSAALHILWCHTSCCHNWTRARNSARASA